MTIAKKEAFKNTKPPLIYPPSNTPADLHGIAFELVNLGYHVQPLEDAILIIGQNIKQPLYISTFKEFTQNQQNHNIDKMELIKANQASLEKIQKILIK